MLLLICLLFIESKALGYRMDSGYHFSIVCLCEREGGMRVGLNKGVNKRHTVTHTHKHTHIKTQRL